MDNETKRILEEQEKAAREAAARATDETCARLEAANKAAIQKMGGK